MRHERKWTFEMGREEKRNGREIMDIYTFYLIPLDLLLLQKKNKIFITLIFFCSFPSYTI